VLATPSQLCDSISQLAPEARPPHALESVHSVVHTPQTQVMPSPHWSSSQKLRK
jgi:hypothetical protein